MEIKNSEITHAHFGLLAGSLSDLSSLDFTPWGLRCYHIKSRILKRFVRDHTHETCLFNNWMEIDSISKHSEGSGVFSDWDKLNVLIPSDLNKLPLKNDIFDCATALSLLFPTELKVRSIIFFQVINGKFIQYEGAETYDFAPFMKYSGKPFEHYLVYHKKERKQINHLMQLYKSRISKLKCANSALDFYVTGWHETNLLMAFVSFCIALEG